MVVATVRALKMHGGVAKTELAQENLPALEAGLPNLLRHVRNMQEVYGLPAVVALNRFPTDTDAEIALVMRGVQKLGVNASLSTVWAEGGKGGEALAARGRRAVRTGEAFRYCYDEKLPVKEKIAAIVRKVYGGDGVEYTPEAEEEIARLEALGFGKLARVHGEDAVFLLGRREKARRARRLHRHGAHRQGLGGCGVRRRAHGQYPNDARASNRPRGGKHRRGPKTAGIVGLCSGMEQLSLLQRAVPPLLEWYRVCKRTLPWRGTHDPYQVWVSEIMLQQTRVEAVKDYYVRFLAALSDGGGARRGG